MSTGDGPVDATYRAIDMLVQVKAELEEFAIQAITEGMDAVGEVSVRLRQDGALSRATAPTPTSWWPRRRRTCTR